MWSRAGCAGRERGMGRGTMEGDSLIPGQERPSPPCIWLEVEMGLLQAPEDKPGGGETGGTAVTPSQ